MLTNTITSLLFIAIFSMLRFRSKFDKLIVPIITFAVSYVFYQFCIDWQNGYGHTTTLIWDSSKSGDIKIDIVSNSTNYLLILPFFINTLIALFNNLFFRFEDKKRGYAAFLILNLLSFIMLIAGNNLIETITFVFVIDILSQLFIKDINASKKYSMYNFIADMGLFLVMAMLKGKLENLEIANITHYYETGRHRDFIMFVLIISLFIKFGFFLFQSYLLDLKSSKFHRLIIIPCLSTPMVSLILLIKLYPLLVVSPSFDICLNIILSLTMLWGAIGMITSNNLKEKTVYSNMLVISILVKVLQSAGFVWNVSLSILLIQNFGFNLCLYYIHYFANRENNLLTMQYINKFAIKMIIFTYILIAGAFVTKLYSVINSKNLIYIFAFYVLFTSSWAHLFSQILSFQNNNKKIKFEIYPLCILFSYAVVSSYLLIITQSLTILIIFIMIFIMLLLLYPFKNVLENRLLNAKLQKIDFFAHIYDVIIVNPVQIMGRWLTILFDFMFLEKTLAVMFSSLNNFTIRIFRKTSRHYGIYYLFNFILALLIVIWCFFKDNR